MNNCDSSPSDPIIWSPQQERIIALITQGFTTGEIAQQMHLTPKRVEKHRNRINGKLGLFGRNQLLQRQRAAFRERHPKKQHTQP